MAVQDSIAHSSVLQPFHRKLLAASPSRLWQAIVQLACSHCLLARRCSLHEALESSGEQGTWKRGQPKSHFTALRASHALCTAPDPAPLSTALAQPQGSTVGAGTSGIGMEPRSPMIRADTRLPAGRTPLACIKEQCRAHNGAWVLSYSLVCMQDHMKDHNRELG